MYLKPSSSVPVVSVITEPVIIPPSFVSLLTAFDFKTVSCFFADFFVGWTLSAGVVAFTVFPVGTTTGDDFSVFSYTLPSSPGGVSYEVVILASVFLISSAPALFVTMETSSVSAGTSACFAAIGFSVISETVYFALKPHIAPQVLSQPPYVIFPVSYLLFR